MKRMESGDGENLSQEHYVHCSICANFCNMNSFSHRKSAVHQRKLSMKLRKIHSHLSHAKNKGVNLHDADWPEKNVKLFCHFCGTEFPVHYVEDEFVVETLGTLYHYSSNQHSQSVKKFLKRNFKEDKSEKFCIKAEDLNCFLAKLPREKEKYVKKMDILDKMMVKQIKDTELERKELVESQLAQSWGQASTADKDKQWEMMKEIEAPVTQCPESNNLPPWLENVPPESFGSFARPQIGPTIDTLIKHVDSLKKKGLPKNRIGANFQHNPQGSANWLPSFQGVWHQSNRKHLRKRFLRRNFGKMNSQAKGKIKKDCQS